MGTLDYNAQISLYKLHYLTKLLAVLVQKVDIAT